MREEEDQWTRVMAAFVGHPHITVSPDQFWQLTNDELAAIWDAGNGTSDGSTYDLGGVI